MKSNKNLQKIYLASKELTKRGKFLSVTSSKINRF